MNYEEELQKNIEAGDPVNADAFDVAAYKAVFDALKRPGESSLSPDFADKIVSRIIRQEKREARRDMLWFALGIFLIMISFIATVVYTGFRLDLGFMKDMSGYAGLLVFGTLFILLLNMLEKKLVRTRERF